MPPDERIGTRGSPLPAGARNPRGNDLDHPSDLTHRTIALMSDAGEVWEKIPQKKPNPPSDLPRSMLREVCLSPPLNLFSLPWKSSMLMWAPSEQKKRSRIS
jgi:hypothetical protein